MDHVELALTACVAVLCLTVVFLSFRLVSANTQLGSFAAKAMEHALANDSEQQRYMRMKLETDQAESILHAQREAAIAARQSSNLPIREMRDRGNDIEVTTRDGIVT